MKRAISALNCQIDKNVAPLFYKCRMFCIHDSEKNRADYYENPYYKMEPGYEVELVGWLKNLGVNEAYSVKFRDEMQKQLLSVGISFFTLQNQESSVLEVIESFESSLESDETFIGKNPCAEKYGN
jgi:predicted Fe-Mo cluster-binding NifX family protein